MKKLILILAVVCASAACNAQVELFKLYANNKDVSQTYISSSMLKLAGAADKSVGKLTGKLKSVRVLECEKAALVPKIKAEALSFYAKNKYEEVLRNEEDGELTIIFQKNATKKKDKELCVLEVEKDEIEIVCIVGDLNLEDLSKLGDFK